MTHSNSHTITQYRWQHIAHPLACGRALLEACMSLLADRAPKRAQRSRQRTSTHAKRSLP